MAAVKETKNIENSEDQKYFMSSNLNRYCNNSIKVKLLPEKKSQNFLRRIYILQIHKIPDHHMKYDFIFYILYFMTE
jgi:hypothetical protein